LLFVVIDLDTCISISVIISVCFGVSDDMG